METYTIESFLYLDEFHILNIYNNAWHLGKCSASVHLYRCCCSQTQITKHNDECVKSKGWNGFLWNIRLSTRHWEKKNAESITPQGDSKRKILDACEAEIYYGRSSQGRRVHRRRRGKALSSESLWFFSLMCQCQTVIRESENMCSVSSICLLGPKIDRIEHSNMSKSR